MPDVERPYVYYLYGRSRSAGSLAVPVMVVDLVQGVRGGFLFGASVVLAVNAVPPLRRRFLLYGSRTVSQQSVELSPKCSLSAFLDYLATLQVPHRYFTHFYVVSVSSSAFWAQQILRNGRLFSAVAALAPKIDLSKAMTKEQILLTWALMSTQGCRRLYESICLAKPSTAKMWFVHWLLGWAFYSGMGLAVWVEGIQTLRSTPPELALSSPSLRTTTFLPLFLFASWMQNKCHRHLASLKKYSLPTHPFFRYIICPHYTAECLIYLSLAGIAAPPGQMFNKTILAALVFVAVNLGATAETTRQWYVEKFGEDKVTALWKMIPFVF
ncbi:protein DFG10 [Guyanagaster necrorhizus]|uniref:Protein DFG10 n=1 Tax=Guyanagaster necrorhizus TaxID=856835 RepID=A0A9P7W2V0_9AGAR|nr:protein DFG10 [Guyanagaster necrorhizus MCA 3950]KAG7451034.1 protein DFG10 [Guyanagaster necrorhizus MCA 3950]